MVVGSALTLVATGCATTAAQDTDAAPTVLTTFTVLADMTENVAGDHVQVESLTRPGAEIHTYEPTPRDMVRASDADLILDNGMGLEAWFTQFTDQVDAPSVTVSQGVEPIAITAGGYAGQDNPHAWMSPDNATIYVENIRAALTDLAPEHAEDFAANAEAYTEEINAIGADTQDALGALPETERALVTCEGAFSYLARDADLEERYLWPVNAEQEATPTQVAEVVDFVSDNAVPAVFCESTVNASTQEQVAAEAGADFGGTLYVDSLSEPDGPVPTYQDLLRHNADTIVAGLTGEEP
ncbi:metal ABC transporter substrate-binding protein [Spiractinospora alimapuensis]|uniref:metal ABC transporter substrate-binding protein n=1 Tax=Spiractinospora alimapuensis TaxID=2820884 RepID=UPI0037433E6C|nr:metal ABC transporter substrate-binding protein [Spiractinospora alimapuensis]